MKFLPFQNNIATEMRETLPNEDENKMSINFVVINSFVFLLIHHNCFLTFVFFYNIKVYPAFQLEQLGCTDSIQTKSQCNSSPNVSYFTNSMS